MRKNRMQRQWPEGDRAFSLYYERVGRTPREHLRWALALVDRPGGWKAFTPGDKDNLRLELATFAGKNAELPGYGGITGSAGKVDTPTDEVAQQILEAFDNMLGAAIRRESISLGLITVEREIYWWEKTGQFLRWEVAVRTAGWMLRARLALGRAIVEAGHLLKVCPAPAPRGEQGKTCDTRFVASRPNQAYCSAKCQTRAATRAYRSGESTAVAQERAAKLEASRKSRKEG
jgi:hypothetical protein